MSKIIILLLLHLIPLKKIQAGNLTSELVNNLFSCQEVCQGDSNSRTCDPSNPVFKNALSTNSEINFSNQSLNVLEDFVWAYNGTNKLAQNINSLRADYREILSPGAAQNNFLRTQHHFLKNFLTLKATKRCLQQRFSNGSWDSPIPANVREKMSKIEDEMDRLKLQRPYFVENLATYAELELSILDSTNVQCQDLNNLNPTQTMQSVESQLDSRKQRINRAILSMISQRLGEADSTQDCDDTPLTLNGFYNGCLYQLRSEAEQTTNISEWVENFKENEGLLRMILSSNYDEGRNLRKSRCRMETYSSCASAAGVGRQFLLDVATTVIPMGLNSWGKAMRGIGRLGRSSRVFSRISPFVEIGLEAASIAGASQEVNDLAIACFGLSTQYEKRRTSKLEKELRECLSQLQDARTGLFLSALGGGATLRGTRLRTPSAARMRDSLSRFREVPLHRLSQQSQSTLREFGDNAILSQVRFTRSGAREFERAVSSTIFQNLGPAQKRRFVDRVLEGISCSR